MKQSRGICLSWRKALPTLVIMIALVLTTVVAGGGTHSFAYNDLGLSQVRVVSSVDSTLGAVSEGCNVKLTASGEGADGAEIYYTLDGTEPTAQSTKYTDAGVDIAATQSGYVTLKALAIKGADKTDVYTYHYEVLKSLAVGATATLVNPDPNPSANNSNVWNYFGTPVSDEAFLASVLDGKMKSTSGQFYAYRNNADTKTDTGNTGIKHENLTTYVQIDLGKTETVNRFRFQTSAYGGTDYVADILDVCVSTDGETYERLPYEVGDPTGIDPSFNTAVTSGDYWKFGVRDRTFADVQARYIRIYTVGRQQSWSYCEQAHMSMFGIYHCDYSAPSAEEVLDPAVPLSAGKTYELVDGVQWHAGGTSNPDSYIVSNSSGGPVLLEEWYGRLGARDLQNANHVASYKNNDDRSTYVQLDLGKEYLVNKIWCHTNPITPETAADITDLVLKISLDGENWTTVYEKAGITEWNRSRDTGNATLHGNAYFRWFELVFSSQKARYVRYQAGTAGATTMLTNLLVYGYAADKTGAWSQPADIAVTSDCILHADDVLAKLNEEHPSATFVATNGVMGNYAVAWEGAQAYTDEDLQAGGEFTYYGVPSFPTFDNVADRFNTAVVAKVTLARPSAKAITDLLEAIDAAELVQADYTSNSWTAYTTARTAAETTRDDVYATSADIGAAASDLQEAYDGLQRLGDPTELNAYINNVKDTAASGYIAGSFAAFTQKLTAAQEVAAMAEPSQAQVEKALSELTAAYEALLTIDKANDLQAAITAAETATPSSDESKYTTASWTAYAQKLAAAKDAVTNATTEAQLAAAETELQTAHGALERLGDKTALEAALTTAKTYKQADYTAASFAALADAIESAEAVMENAQATQTQADAAREALLEKIEALVALGDATELKEKIASYGDGSKYTSSSWETFASVLDNVKSVADASSPTADEVAEAMAQLTEAEKNLVLRGDKTALNAQLAKTVDAAKYTQLSVAEYNKVKTSAQTVANNIDATQAQVDEALGKLTQAEGKLVPLGDKTALKALIEACEGIAKGSYTDDSYGKLTTALEYAKSIDGDSQATQEDVDGAAAQLTTAKEGLKKSGGCGGNVASAATIPSVLLLAVAFTLLSRKRKQNA